VAHSSLSALELRLRESWREALTGFALERRILAAVRARSDAEPVAAIAIGKAAATMLSGAFDAGVPYAESLAVVPTRAAVQSLAGRAGVRVIHAAHPIPDEKSVEAGEAALDLARRLNAGTLHVFLSGGASALACAPAPGVSLAEKAALTKVLLRSGADVREVNVIRRHLSRLKGGGLLRVASVPVVSFLVSDVLRGSLADIGSGPSVADPTTTANAKALLERYAPDFADRPLIETVKPGGVEAEKATSILVASPDTFVAFLCERLRANELRPRVVSALTLDVDTVARTVGGLAATLDPGEAVVCSAEPTVRTLGEGRGGRDTHLAALVLGSLPPDVVLLAGATDGVDGASETGGAVVSRELVSKLDAGSLEASLARFDTGRLLEAHRATLPFGPTGLNFADVLVIARSREP
jgi:hydroxypyruvate reductase